MWWHAVSSSACNSYAVPRCRGDEADLGTLCSHPRDISRDIERAGPTHWVQPMQVVVDLERNGTCLPGSERRGVKVPTANGPLGKARPPGRHPFSTIGQGPETGRTRKDAASHSSVHVSRKRSRESCARIVARATQRRPPPESEAPNRIFPRTIIGATLIDTVELVMAWKKPLTSRFR